MVVIVGNKSDLSDQRQVTTEELEQKGKELDINVIEVSAKTGANINELFNTVATTLPSSEMSQILSPHTNQPPNTSNNVQVPANEQRNLRLGAGEDKAPVKKEGCC
eukprot:TRINITY_DN1804_c0_g1_i4.p1 TRINITY_DN1804_c0_g1~~TRINITY_DN1804_c0_g1_i4.p1  ORF type:complete len:106 (+),score=29.23 TRINITY_DN1804_c0_g1_i4:487-804(+)